MREFTPPAKMTADIDSIIQDVIVKREQFSGNSKTRIPVLKKK
jgi:hypothetical protein